MPFTLSTILAATDFSPAAADAFAYAHRLAEALNAEVRLLHVLAAPDPSPAIPEELQAGNDEAKEAHALEALHQLAATQPRETACTVRRSRSAADGIVDEAREAGAELLVLGRCGHRPSRLGLGSVSGEVIQMAPCDVVLVPDRSEAPFSQAPVERLLVPVDFSGATAPLLSLSRQLGEALDAQVDVVHVLEPLPHPVRWLDETIVDLVPQIRERAGGALRKVVEEAGLDTERTKLYVERGKAASSIPKVAEVLGSDLIFLGPHAERPVFDRLLGSVAEGVARRTSCPVYIARKSAVPREPSSVDPHRYEATV